MKIMKSRMVLIASVLFTIILCSVFIKIRLDYGNTPEGVIRRQLFAVNPVHSITCTINKTDYFDRDYGRQYTITGFPGTPASGGGIFFAYVKRDAAGLYYCSGTGSGP